MKLSIERTQDDRATTVFTLSGDLHGTAEGYAFQEAVRAIFAGGIRRVVVDLQDVRRIDSCGIGILAAIAMSAQNSGGGLVLASLPERIEKILGVTHFLSHVDHAASVAEATRKLDGMGLAPQAGAEPSEAPGC